MNNLLTIWQNLSCFLYGPGEAKYEDRAVPEIKDPYDVIIRINYIGVCGSDVSYFVFVDCCFSSKEELHLFALTPFAAVYAAFSAIAVYHSIP